MSTRPRTRSGRGRGDILLFHGDGFVPWAIRRFDESDVDRAAIVLRPGTMAEATASGLRRVAIEPADLRYSHSLETITSLRPSDRSSTTSGGRGREPHDADR